MKQRITALVLLLVSGLSIAFTSADPENRPLLNALEKLYQHDVYYRFTEYSVQGDAQSQPLTSELWKQGGRIKVENPYSVLIKDEHTQINIVHGAKIIVIRDIVAVREPVAPVTPSFEGYQLQVAEGAQKQTYTYTLDAAKEGYQVPFEKAVYTFDTQKQQIVRTEFYPKASEPIKQVCTFEQITFDGVKAPFEGAALNYILTPKQAIRPAYQSYTIRDLRKKQ